MTRRTLGILTLGLALALLCLAIGGLACTNLDNVPDRKTTAFQAPKDERWKCVQVVGDRDSTVQVYSCYDPARDACWYINHSGRMMQVDCIEHPIAE